MIAAKPIHPGAQSSLSRRFAPMLIPVFSDSPRESVPPPRTQTNQHGRYRFAMLGCTRRAWHLRGCRQGHEVSESRKGARRRGRRKQESARTSTVLSLRGAPPSKTYVRDPLDRSPFSILSKRPSASRGPAASVSKHSLRPRESAARNDSDS